MLAALCNGLAGVRMFRWVAFFSLLAVTTAVASATGLVRQTNSSLPRRTQELLAHVVEFAYVPLFPIIDAAAGLRWQQRLRAKNLIVPRDGIYATQLGRYQNLHGQLTAKFYHDRYVHYLLDGVSHIGIASPHAQPENERLLSVSGQEINIAEQVSGVLVWNHVNYGKRVAFSPQDGQRLYASGAAKIPDDIDMLYGIVDGVFSDDYHRVTIAQARTQSRRLLELPHTTTFIVPRLAITSIDDKHRELRSLLQ